MILGSHSVWVSGSVEMLLEVAVTKICSYCPQNVILPILVMHFITIDCLQKASDILQISYPCSQNGD